MEQKAAMLDALRDGIVRLCSPLRIYVYNQKTSTAGELSSVKLCVVIPDGDSRETCPLTCWCIPRRNGRPCWRPS